MLVCRIFIPHRNRSLPCPIPSSGSNFFPSFPTRPPPSIVQLFIAVEELSANVNKAVSLGARAWWPRHRFLTAKKWPFFSIPKECPSASIAAAVIHFHAQERATSDSLEVSYSRTDEPQRMALTAIKNSFFSQTLLLSRPYALFALSLLVFGSFSSAAQEPLAEKKGDHGVLKGTVINSVTRAPVSRALVHSLDNRFATLTDDEGRFELKVPRAENQTSGSTSTEPTSIFVTAPSAGVLAGQAAAQLTVQAIYFQLRARKPGYLTDTNVPELTASEEGAPELTIALVPEALLTGRVELPSEATVDRGRVQLYRRQVQEGRGGWVLASSAMTDSEGEFRFADLPAGEYKVFTDEILDHDQMTFDPRAQLYGFPPVYFPNASDFDSAGVIHLAAGTTSSANLAPVRREYYAVRIAVTNGAPGNGHNVLVFPQGHDGPGYSLAYNEHEQMIEGLLPNGAYTLEVASYGQGATSGQMNFSVRGAPFVGRSINLAPNGSIQVTVKHESESSAGPGVGVETLSDQTQAKRNPGRGRDVQVTLISLEQFNRASMGSRPKGAEGETMVFENVPPGRYRVSVQVARGYAGTVISGGTDLLRQVLVVSEGVAAPSIDITIRDDGAHVQGEIEHWSEEARVHGLALNVPGHPPACVYFVPRSEGSGQFRIAWVNDGKFELSQVPPGEYEVLAFDRQPLDLEYESGEVLQKYEGKWQGVYLGPGANESLTVSLTRADE